MAAVLILEPIFEADLQAEQHAYRAKHSAQEAVKEVHGWLKKGLREVVDADLSGYFDTIPHAQLMKSLARRISDDVAEVLAEPAVLARIRDLASEPGGETPEVFAQRVRSDLAIWQETAKAAGIEPE